MKNIEKKAIQLFLEALCVYQKCSEHVLDFHLNSNTWALKMKRRRYFANLVSPNELDARLSLSKNNLEMCALCHSAYCIDAKAITWACKSSAGTE